MGVRIVFGTSLVARNYIFSLDVLENDLGLLRSYENEIYIWVRGDSNPGPSACKADVIPLDHGPYA